MDDRHALLRRIGRVSLALFLVAAAAVVIAARWHRWRRRGNDVSFDSYGDSPAATITGCDDVTNSGDRTELASVGVTDATDDVLDTIETEAEPVAADEPVGPATVYAASEARVAFDVPDQPAHTTAVGPAVDLALIERDLEGVAAALARLDEGTYWTDEVTGEPLADDVLVADPVARRNR